MKRQQFVPYLILMVLVLFVSLAASADERVRCESKGNHRECAYETDGTVALERQLSVSACIEGETWGYDDDVIWVDQGCRADFRVTPRRDNDDNEDNGETITCESYGRRRVCEANIPFGVRLMKQLGRANCVRGETWGYDDDGVWVTGGCRGEFLIENEREGRERPGDHQRGEWQREQYRITTCESKDSRNHFCAVDTRFGVELTRQLSISDCTFRRTWGYSDHGIWVKDGCRAEFAIRTR